MPPSDSRVRESLLEKPLLGEGGGEAFNRCKEIIKRWHNRFTFQNLAFAKRYFENEFRIQVHFRHESEGVELCALFNNVGPLAWPGEKRPLLRQKQVRKSRRIDLHTREGVSDQNHSVVLVGVVETPNSPERVAFLECVDTKENVHNAFHAAVWFSLKSGFRTLGIGVDGEMVAPRALRSPHGPLPEVIQGNVQVMNRVGSDGAPHRRDLLSHVDVERSSVGFVNTLVVRIRLADNWIWASFAEGQNLGFQITDVFVGPVNLDPSAGGPITHEDA
jgi:hypothetical protein